MKHLTQKAAYQAADAEADIDLINRYTKKELTPEEVYVFSVILCDNDVDRDNERFTEKALEKLATLFEGRAGLLDHAWSAKGQNMRLYKTAVEGAEGDTVAGTPKIVLRGWAYMVRTADNEGLIAEIEGGIKKEVSVGCAMGDCVCSICGKSGMDLAGCGHIKGRTYDGTLCYFELTDPMDAYEWSFVAVPAQRGAGVTKAAGVPEAEQALEMLLGGGLALCGARLNELETAIKAHRAGGAEGDRRQEITRENTAIQAVFTIK